MTKNERKEFLKALQLADRMLRAPGIDEGMRRKAMDFVESVQGIFREAVKGGKRNDVSST